jgi:hypothetical protein
MVEIEVTFMAKANKKSKAPATDKAKDATAKAENKQ